jgi:hypothetical protein
VKERGIHQAQATAAGLACDRSVTFAGEVFRLRKPALAPLLTYLAAAHAQTAPAEGMAPWTTTAQREDDEAAQQTAMLAAGHRLLQAAVTAADWPQLQAAATSSKATAADIDLLIRAVIEQWTAWPYWPGARLLAHLAAAIPERDGTLMIRAGRSLSGLTPRQACNVTYALLLSGIENAEDRDQFTEDLMYAGNPEAEAMAKVRQMQAGKPPGEDQAGG